MVIGNLKRVINSKSRTSVVQSSCLWLLVYHSYLNPKAGNCDPGLMKKKSLVHSIKELGVTPPMLVFQKPSNLRFLFMHYKWMACQACSKKNQFTEKQKVKVLVMVTHKISWLEATTLHNGSKPVNVMLKQIHSKTHAKGKKKKVLASLINQAHLNLMPLLNESRILDLQ